MRLVAGRIFVVNPHLLLIVCFDNLLEIYIFIAEADAALFIGKVDGMLRAVLDAGVAYLAVVAKPDMTVFCLTDVADRADFCTDTALHAGVIDCVLLCCVVFYLNDFFFHELWYG